jgi:hypothetical protein
MKVLTPGRPQKGWAKECTCTGVGNGGGGCGALLLVEFADLYKTYHSCMGEVDTFITFSCGACGVETDLSCSVPNSDLVRKHRTSG